MKLTADELKTLAGHMFEKQRNMLPLWQTISDHFYPERSDFLYQRNIGEEVVDGLASSYPIMVRRDLCDSFGSMLRDGEFFKMTTDLDRPGLEAKQFLEWLTRRQYKLMVRPDTGFVRTTKQSDHDYGTFGQAVMSVEMNRKYDGLLYRSWHLKDCAWMDDETGAVGPFVRKWSTHYRNAYRTFGDKLHPDVTKEVLQFPFKMLDMYHFRLPSEYYGEQKYERFPYVSIYLDIERGVLIEETGTHNPTYVIPRFQTISGSPYAYSPATMIGLPDARTIQAMTHTLLEAGERYTRPPLIATSGAVRSDIDLSSDGITWVDKDYDEKFGEALRTLQYDRGGFPYGQDMRENVMAILSSAFYLNKITLPETTREMTAYEVAERMKQFRRENLPLFAPIEAEYNGQLCELTFNVLLRSNMFGPVTQFPKALQGRDVNFKFESPLSSAEEEKKVNQFKIVGELLASAAEYDSGVALNVDFDMAVRDAIDASGAPNLWLRNEDAVKDARQQVAQAQAAQQMQQVA